MRPKAIAALAADAPPKAARSAVRGLTPLTPSLLRRGSIMGRVH